MEGGAFSAERLEDVIVIRFGQHQMVLSADIGLVDELMAYLSAVDADASVKSVVVVGSPEDGGEAEYARFLEQSLQPGKGEFLLKRMFSAFDRFILWAASSPKMVVCAARGTVLMDYIGILLTCDHVVYADNVVVTNPHMDAGLVPKGGAALLLPQAVGKSKAYEMLLSSEPIPLSRLVELGIAGDVVPVDRVEEAAIEAARKFASMEGRSLAGVKKLMGYALRDLGSFLAYENAILDRLTIRMMHGE